MQHLPKPLFTACFSLQFDARLSLTDQRLNDLIAAALVQIERWAISFHRPVDDRPTVGVDDVKRLFGMTHASNTIQSWDYFSRADFIQFSV